MGNILNVIEPEAVQARKHRKFTRREFYTAGVNEFWAMDQHDKMKKYGLRYHVCVQPASGRIMWLKAWWTNSNPRIVLKFYLDTVRTLGCEIFFPLLLIACLTLLYRYTNLHDER